MYYVLRLYGSVQPNLNQNMDLKLKNMTSVAGC